MKRLIVFLVAIITAFSLQKAILDNSAASEILFPIVFTSNDDLAKFGISITANSDMLHKCYYYGDGGELIRVSHERLLRYREMGFTLNSLCLGLMSSSLFDPETGKRLPTYIVVDPKSLASGKRHDVEATYEHPLELPPCFRRALVYSDCVFNYDRLNGKRLPTAKTDAFRELGVALDNAFQRAIEQRLVCNWPYCTERRTGELNPGSLAAGGYGATLCSNEGYLKHVVETTFAEHGINVPKTVLEDADLSCFDVSINLPAGYGYTMDADGTAGPSLSDKVLQEAIDPKRRFSQLDPKELSELIKAQLPLASAGQHPH
jgi:hypothetical protein